jgi:ADP-ribose pyrophosphatase
VSEQEPKRIGRRTVQSGTILEFMEDTVRLPDGKVENWDFVHHKKGGGACAVPVLPDGRILMIRQFRPCIDSEVLELPAGVRDASDPDTSVTAARELEEETGYRCGRIEKLLSIDTAVAWCDEKTDIYLAEDLVKTGEQTLDEAESIRLCPMTLKELLEGIREGRIRDAKTAAGVLAYAVRKGAHEYGT